MNTPHTHRGLTLIELMLALTVTVIIGAGLAALLTMISQVTSYDRDTRTGALRAHAAQIRLQAYSETGLCTLQDRKDGSFAFWLEDADTGGTVNLLEIRVFWVDGAGQLACERVEPAEAWTDEEIAAFNVELASNTDFFTVMLNMRKAGFTSSVIIVDGLTDAGIEYDTVAAVNSSRPRFRFTQTFASGSVTETLVALPLTNHRVPEL